MLLDVSFCHLISSFSRGKVKAGAWELQSHSLSTMWEQDGASAFQQPGRALGCALLAGGGATTSISDTGMLPAPVCSFLVHLAITWCLKICEPLHWIPMAKRWFAARCQHRVTNGGYLNTKSPESNVVLTHCLKWCPHCHSHVLVPNGRCCCSHCHWLQT